MLRSKQQGINIVTQLQIFADKPRSDIGEHILGVLVILHLFFLYASVLLILSNVYIANVYADALPVITKPAEVNPATPEKPESTETTKTDEPQESGKLSDQKKQQKTTKEFDFTILLIGILFGLCIGITRLIYKFHPFIGLGILTNKCSLLFLFIVVVTTSLFYILISYLPLEDVTSIFAVIGAPIGAPIAGNLSTILARLSSTKILNTGSIKDVKGSQKSVSTNVLFEFIRRDITTRLSIKILQLSREYEWDEIKTVCGRLIDGEIATNHLSAEEGEERKKFIQGFNKSETESEDINNKHAVLHRTIQVIFYSQLVSGLKSIRTHV